MSSAATRRRRFQGKLSSKRRVSFFADLLPDTPDMSERSTGMVWVGVLRLDEYEQWSGRGGPIYSVSKRDEVGGGRRTRAERGVGAVGFLFLESY